MRLYAILDFINLDCDRKLHERWTNLEQIEL
jgi:hypothetical protein